MSCRKPLMCKQLYLSWAKRKHYWYTKLYALTFKLPQPFSGWFPAAPCRQAPQRAKGETGGTSAYLEQPNQHGKSFYLLEGVRHFFSHHFILDESRDAGSERCSCSSLGLADLGALTASCNSLQICLSLGYSTAMLISNGVSQISGGKPRLILLTVWHSTRFPSP